MQQEGSTLFLCLALTALPLFPSPLEIERKARQGHHLLRLAPSAYIDWTEGKIYVSVRKALYGTRDMHSGPQPSPSLSEIRSRTRQLAQKEAHLKLASLTYDLCLDSETLVKDRMQQDQYFQRRMGDLSSRFRVEARHTGADYVNLRLSLPFWGQKGLYALIADNRGRRLALPKLQVQDSSLSISSLIFVVQGAKGFQSSLTPRFYSREGLLFYSPEIADLGYSIQKGLVVYYTSIEKAREDIRAGSNPYIAYAAGLRGTKKSDLVVHDQDLVAILGSPSGRTALRRSNVILVTSKEGE